MHALYALYTLRLCYEPTTATGLEPGSMVDNFGDRTCLFSAVLPDGTDMQPNDINTLLSSSLGKVTIRLWA